MPIVGNLGGGRLFVVFGVLDVGPLAMVGAIGFIRFRRVAAEAEILLAGLSIGPAAHAGAKRLKADDLGLFWLFLDGRTPFRQAQTVNLADDGVLGDGKPVTDFAGWKAFVPQGDEYADARGRPFL